MNAEIDKFKQYMSHRYPGSSTTKHYMSDLAIFQNFVGDMPVPCKNSIRRLKPGLRAAGSSHE